MVVGDMPEAVDFVVIGAGPGGYTAALAAAAAGRDVVLVDAAGDGGVGGVCLLEGCIPSKALIRLANAAHRRADDAAMGLTYDGRATIDLAQFQMWKNGVVHTLGDGVRRALASAGVRIISGRAAFIDETTVRVRSNDAPSTILEFRDLVIATGCVPVDVPGLNRSDPRVVDAAGVLDLDSVPKRVAVVGAGYIGIELGTALAKLGSSVTLVEAQNRILPGMAAAAAREVSRTLRRLGVTIVLNATVRGMCDNGVELTAAGEVTSVPANLVVVAVGRRPVTSGLALDKAQITVTEQGYINVADDLRCRPHIAAIGDVTAGPGLAHRAIAEARFAVAALCGEPLRVDHVIPTIVFSDPEIASVGYTLTDAKRVYPSAAEATVPLARAGRSIVEQSSRGFATLVYDGESRRLLGATVCSVWATEIISELTLAIEAALSVDDIAATVHPHPTINEINGEAALAAAP